MTPNGVQLPLIIKNGLMYLKHYHPTERQMAEIDREEFMTAKTEWDPSKLDDIEGASDLSIRQFLPTPIDATDSFYNSQGDIRANKSDLKDDSVVSDASSKNSGNKRVGYRPKPRKEKKKKKGKWINNKKLKLKDQMKTPSFPVSQFPNAPTTF